MKKLTSKEQEFIKMHYSDTKIKDIAKYLNKGYHQIVYFAKQNNIEKGTHYKKISLADTAYIAGFIDADGSIQMRIKKEQDNIQISPMIEASNTNREVLEWIKSMLYEKDINSHFVQDPVQKRFDKRYKRTLYHLYISGRFRVKYLLKKIIPFLHVKKRRAGLLLEYIQTHNWGKKNSKHDLKIILKFKKEIDSIRKKHIEQRKNLEEFIQELLQSH